MVPVGRLRRTIDVQRVRREGTTRSDALFHVTALATRQREARLAIGVPARLGGAVLRNRARRRARAAFERALSGAEAGADLLVTVRRPALEASFPALAGSAAELLRSLGVVPAEP